MSSTTRDVLVRAPVQDVVTAISQPDDLMAIVGEFGRSAYISTRADGSQEWVLFIVMGTIYVGGRGLVKCDGEGSVSWRSLSGFEYRARIRAIPAQAGTRLEATADLKLEGLIAARVAGFLVRNFMGRHLDATLQRLRHHIEYNE